MSTDYEACRAVLNLGYRGDHAGALRCIARELDRIATERETQDRAFLTLLADMIDPDRPSHEGAKLTVTRDGTGAPKSQPDWRPGYFMWASVVVLGGKAESVAAEAREVFGISRSRAFEALAETKADAERNPAIYELHAETLRVLDESGHLSAHWESL